MANSRRASTPWRTHSVSWTGFSVDPPAYHCRYTLNTKNRICTIMLRIATPGTSNATDFTMTFPVPSKNLTSPNGQVRNFPIIIMNNGTLAAGRLDLANNSNIATIFSSIGGAGTFTASGSKAAYFTISYEY